MNKVNRIAKIIDILESKDKVSAKMLAKGTNVNVRTVYRDINTLDEMGYLVIREKGGYRLIHKPNNAQRGLSEVDLLALIVKKPLLIHGEEEKSGGELYHTSKAATHREKRLGKLIGTNIINHSFYWDHYDEDMMISFIKAIDKKKIVTLTYFSPATMEETIRKVNPYYIVNREEHYYVVAYCHLKNAFRNFRMDRIKDYSVHKDSFQLNDDFSIIQHLKEWKMGEEDERIHFVVKFSPKVAKYVKEKTFYEQNARIDEEEDGSILLSIKTMKKYFLRWIRKYGLDAEILEPIEIRTECREEFKALYERYK